jgi:hypothetical protein
MSWIGGTLRAARCIVQGTPKLTAPATTPTSSAASARRWFAGQASTAAARHSSAPAAPAHAAARSREKAKR